LAGFGDLHLRWCLGLALWNGRDPILKERLYGLTNEEGNHGEDVKELYYYLDATPTHTYNKMLYKYPQAAFPYDALLHENRARGREVGEYELIDTGVFEAGRYFDVFVEYAKAAPDDILMRITVFNRGKERATLHVLPQLWARNDWSWRADAPRPLCWAHTDGAVRARHDGFALRRFSLDREAKLLFCENETNVNRLYGGHAPGPFKDGFHDFVVGGRADAVSPIGEGTKCAFHVVLDLAPGASETMQARLRPVDAKPPAPGDGDAVFANRIAEADAFYAAVQDGIADADARLVQRQAFAGLLWSKQYYNLDVPVWLDGDPATPPPPPSRKTGRNADWQHLNNDDVLSMPDKWEYPWYAAWDLAFHCVTFSAIDPDFAKGQLVLLTREWYMHPNGQLPAYEWAFGDVNPPVHAWAAWRVYMMDKAITGTADIAFLERVFHKLMLNFTWWVNRKDADGRNIFQGGFLGLDNIGVFDRSAPLPIGGKINQSDGTAWMAMYALNLMRIALELAMTDHVYEDIATKFFEHFLQIAKAMDGLGGGKGLWDEQDQFFYDALELPDGTQTPLRVRSIVGLVPMFAVEVLTAEMMNGVPGFTGRLRWYLDHRPDLSKLVSRWHEKGEDEQTLLSLLRGHRTKMLIRRMMDEAEFLSDHGVRALSKIHRDHPYVLERDGQRFTVEYMPAESTTGLFGGNSNWRGPVWMPINYMLVDALRQFHRYYGDEFEVEFPVGSGRFVTLANVADELTRRLTRLFLRNASGRRAVFGDNAMLQGDPEFRDHLIFPEYFSGDTGRACGASHQNGWTSLIALLLYPPARDAFQAVAKRDAVEVE
ncbi:MAG: glucosidase, partial [Acidisphaera sp.]|nr:glucosidase [Acidisphaera sp.]